MDITEVNMLDDRIKKIYIELSSACNLKCDICFRNSWIDEKQGLMSADVLGKVYQDLNKMKDVDSVVFGGMGEPLLHSEICNFVDKVSLLGIKTELITNGTLLSEDVSEQLIESGLSQLWISADESHIQSSNNDIFTRNINYFNSVRKNNCKLGLTYALVNPILDDLIRIQKFAKHLKADEINISQIIPSELIEKLEYNDRLFIGKRRVDNLLIQTERKLNYCPFIQENNVFVKWNGDIVPCMQLLHSSHTYLFEEKRKVMAYSFGNILNSTLVEIWNREEYKEFRERVRNFDFPDCTLCNGCDDRVENRTDCMYNTMPTCGACLWAQNIARCP